MHFPLHFGAGAARILALSSLGHAILLTIQRSKCLPSENRNATRDVWVPVRHSESRLPAGHGLFRSSTAPLCLMRCTSTSKARVRDRASRNLSCLHPFCQRLQPWHGALDWAWRSEEHTSELQSLRHLV